MSFNHIEGLVQKGSLASELQQCHKLRILSLKGNVVADLLGEEGLRAVIR